MRRTEVNENAISLSELLKGLKRQINDAFSFQKT